MLDELRALLEKASPGPWRVATYGSGQANVVFPRGREMAWPPFATIYGNAGIATTLADGSVVGETGSDLDGLSEAEYNDQRLNDAMFVAALRNAAPDLLATVTGLTKDEAERVVAAIRATAQVPDGGGVRCPECLKDDERQLDRDGCYHGTKPAAPEGPKCQTCGSDDPALRDLIVSITQAGMTYETECHDPFHDAPAPDAQEGAK